MTNADLHLLDPRSVVPYLISRGVLGGDEPAEVCPLGGGVSNVVLAVQTPSICVVVKQSLPQLRVAEQWLAKRERALTEAAALQLAGELTPGSVPAVLDADPEAFSLTIACAPASWANWKDELLAGRADPSVAARLGRLLATWHACPDAARFDDAEAFDQLRVDPYYRTVMRRHAEVADVVGECIARMAACRQSLVHGDYSPKNVLVGDGQVWVLDFEVAHCGDPAFDVAFLLNHLVLKALHRPQDAARYEQCSRVFWGAYGLVEEPEYVLAHLGCLLLARVDGKSPAEYLTAAERDTARVLGLSVLTDPPRDLPELWARV
jgi:aminoglycoside phosphotransferase (APT) family kinase protein